jgi:MATE family multidrug resistance protein
MWIGAGLVIDLLVPPSAVSLFHSAWLIVVVVQPVNALAFSTDGIHWGTGDYRYLRNAVLLATCIGALGLFLVPHSLNWVWMMTAIWIGVRATMGMVRIWPGIGKSPLRFESQKRGL